MTITECPCDLRHCGTCACACGETCGCGEGCACSIPVEAAPED